MKQKFVVLSVIANISYEFFGEIEHNSDYYTLIVESGFLIKDERKIPIDGRVINRIEEKNHIVISDTSLGFPQQEGGLYNFSDIISFYLFKFKATNTLYFQVVHQSKSITNQKEDNVIDIYKAKNENEYSVSSSAYPQMSEKRGEWRVFIGGYVTGKLNIPWTWNFLTAKELNLTFERVYTSLRNMVEDYKANQMEELKTKEDETVLECLIESEVGEADEV